MTAAKRITDAILWRVKVPSIAEHVRRLTGGLLEVDAVLDVGSGVESPLAPFRSAGVRLIGLDISSAVVSAMEASGRFDGCIVGDVRTARLDDLCTRGEVDGYDIVAAVDLIEHLRKDEGFAFLDLCEQLTRRFVVIVTPLGFVPQGPEHGNEYQRHLSGWFPEEFEGRGYTVEGAYGSRWMVQHAARLPLPWPIFKFVNGLTYRATRARTNPRRAFHLLAVKDVRGVPARRAQPGRAG